MLLKKITFQSTIGYYGAYFVFDRCLSQLTCTSINSFSGLIKGDQPSTLRLRNKKKKIALLFYCGPTPQNLIKKKKKNPTNQQSNSLGFYGLFN